MGGKISQRPWVLPRAFFIGGSELRVGIDRIHLNQELGTFLLVPGDGDIQSGIPSS